MNCEYVQLICNGLYTNGKEILGQYVRGKQSLFHSLNLVKGITFPSFSWEYGWKGSLLKERPAKTYNHKIKGLLINDAVFNPSLHVSPFGQMELVEKGLFQVAVSGTQQSLGVLCQHPCVPETLENIRLKDNIGSWYDPVL